jgi:lipopolysaccharide transport system permease protein
VLDIVPDGLRKVLAVNPIVPLVNAYHSIFAQHVFPQWGELIYPTVLALFLLGLGGLVFLRLSGEIVDEL